MACNRNTSADSTTSSATPVCPNPDARVACCNTNCHSFGCTATMNLCSQCYSDHLLKEGGAFINKPCDTPPVARSNEEGAADPHIGPDNSTEQIVDASSLSGSTVDTSLAVNASGLQRSKDKSSVCTNMMHTSPSVSDLHAVFGLQQRISSPLGQSAACLQASLPLRRQVETKTLSLPPMVPRQAVNRCLTCRKRVGLLGFKCRCGDIFCTMHRYSEKHDCSFDYKAAGRAAIAKENPIVKASKIERI